MQILSQTAKRRWTLVTDRILSLPVLVLMPHSACNCRCVMCDIWRANASKQELSLEDLLPHVESFRKLGVRRVVLSGGEALMHSNLWALCHLLGAQGIGLTLLSSGLLLRNHAAEVVRHCDEVIVSLDGSREVHNHIRNVPRAYERLVEGVEALRKLSPSIRIAGRCVVQHHNYFDLANIIRSAHEIGLDCISFLAADVSTTAFNRAAPWSDGRIAEMALSEAEVKALRQIIEQVLVEHASDLRTGFIAESPEKLRRLPAYYAALCGMQPFPQVKCNAPWVSTVVEADGTVRPCFFHRPLGNLREQPLEEILNSEDALSFRRNLDVRTDPICKKCVCSLHLKPRAAIPIP